MGFLKSWTVARGLRMNQNTKRTLYVSGLSDEVDNRLLRAAFIPFGEIVDAQLSLNPGSQSSRGYGFVEYESLEDARAAMDNMHQAELCGKVLNVTIAKPQAFVRSDKPVWEDADMMQEDSEEPETKNQSNIKSNPKIGPV